MNDQAENKNINKYCLGELACEIGVLSRPDGSAVFCQGNTVVQAAVYGPADVKQQLEDSEKAVVDVIYRPKNGLSGCAEKMDQRIIRNITETVLIASLYPRSSITVILQEMHNAGGMLSCAVNGAVAALLDSGMAMRNTAAAVSAVLTEGGDLVLNPSGLQEQESCANFTFVFDSCHGKSPRILASSAKGRFNDDQLNRCIKLCSDASISVVEFYRGIIAKKYCKEV